MASIYKVKNQQNVFDVAIQLYGSIEGLFDLLITNDWLGMDSVLEDGQELLYHPEFIIKNDIVAAINREGILIGNGEGTEPFTHGTDILGVINLSLSTAGPVKFSAAGSGKVQVDWGDDCIEEYSMTTVEQPIAHRYFSSGTYNVYIYGGSITALNMKGISGKFYPIKVKNTLTKYCEDRNLLASVSCISLFSSTLQHFEWNNRTEAMAINTYLNGKTGLKYCDVTGSNVTSSAVGTFISSVNSNKANYTSLTCYFDGTQVTSNTRTLMKSILNDSTNGSKFKFYIDHQLVTK